MNQAFWKNADAVHDEPQMGLTGTELKSRKPRKHLEKKKYF